MLTAGGGAGTGAADVPTGVSVAASVDPTVLEAGAVEAAGADAAAGSGSAAAFGWGTVGAAVRFGLLIITTKKLPSLTPVSASVCSSFSTLPA